MVILLTCGPVHAEQSRPLFGERAAAPASTDALAQSLTWRRLLYIQTGKPEIAESRFFLTPATGVRMDDLALAELRATLEQADSPAPEAGGADGHPRCIFPARYFWLGMSLDRPHWKQVPSFCKKLNEWLAQRPSGVFSLLMVSGYVTNPGSTFGHTLIRLSDRKGTVADAGDKPTVLDTAFNFGAAIPENEPALLYLMRGLFGGYDSGFSTGTYYQHDQVYSRQEMRDIWAYELLLTEDEAEFARLRVAELLGQLFDYYFLSHNCALRMGQLFDLVTGQSRFSDNPLYLTPIELFQRNAQADQTERPLLGPVTFIASRHRMLTERLRDFTPAQIRVYDALVTLQGSQQEAHLHQNFSDFKQFVATAGDPRQQAAVVDAALTLWEARILSKRERQVEVERQRKDRLLKVRLTLPVGDSFAAASLKPLPRPDDGNAVLAISAGPVLGERQHFVGNKGGVGIRVTPYKHDNESFHAIQNFGQLRVLDAVGFIRSDGDVQLNRLEIIKISTVATKDVTGLDNWFARHFSWESSVGFDRLPHSGRYLSALQKSGVQGMNAYTRLAVGPSARIGDTTLVTARMAGLLGNVSDWLVFYPEMAIEHRTMYSRLSLLAADVPVKDRMLGDAGRVLWVKASLSYSLDAKRNVLAWTERQRGRLDSGVAGIALEWRF